MQLHASGWSGMSMSCSSMPCSAIAGEGGREGHNYYALRRVGHMQLQAVQREGGWSGVSTTSCSSMQ